MSKFTSIVTISKWAVVPVALMASGLLVWQSSYAAFSSTTTNPTNNWTAGTVALTDDDSNTAMFTASALKPGATGEKCIAVTSSGNLASTVKLYATTYSTTGALGSYIDLVIQEGSGGSFSSCTGFTSAATNFTGTLAAFAAANTNFGNGLSSWAPAPGTVTRTFRIAYTINTSAPNSAQGGTAAAGLTWEAQNS